MNQCVITGEEGAKQSLVTVDPKTGNIATVNLTGDTIVFNSYSDIRGCNPTKSARTNFQVKIVGNVAAVLDANLVAKYRAEEQVEPPRPPNNLVARAEEKVEPPRPPNMAAVLEVARKRIEEKESAAVGSKRKLEERVDLTSLDSLYLEIARQREECEQLLRDEARPTISEALLALAPRPHCKPVSFATALVHSISSESTTPGSSSEMLVCRETDGTAQQLTREQMAISVLKNLRPS